MIPGESIVVATAFDPYHRWLGIRPEDQPADHYRLLGLSRFEDDPEAIRDAAERQIAHVRRYALGQHQAISQKILNELAAAKACLLNPDKKQAYDGTLRQAETSAVGGHQAATTVVPERCNAEDAAASDAAPAPEPPVVAEWGVPTAAPVAPEPPPPENLADWGPSAVAALTGAGPAQPASPRISRGKSARARTGTKTSGLRIPRGALFVVGLAAAVLVLLAIVSGVFDGAKRGDAKKERVATAKAPTGSSNPAPVEAKPAEAVPPEAIAPVSAGNNQGSGVSLVSAGKSAVPAPEEEGPQHPVSSAAVMPSKGGQSPTANPKPVIQSVMVTPDRVAAGGQVTVTITARSDAPLPHAACWFSFGQANKISFLGGCQQVEPGVWQCVVTQKISEWQPAGRYTLDQVQLRDEGNQKADSWKGDASFTISSDRQPAKPVIQSVTVTPDRVAAGGQVTVTITARSDAPLPHAACWFSFGQANKISFLGGCQRVEPGVWKCVFTQKISEWQPAGRYTLDQVQLRDEGNQKADPWKGDASFTISNDRQLAKPVIQSVTVTPDRVAAGGQVTVTITARSDAPVPHAACWFSLGHAKKIPFLGGCQQLEPSVWKCVVTRKISEWQPAGRYTLDQVQLRDEGNQKADPWKGGVSFTVTP
jgi:hypothetical protein